MKENQKLKVAIAMSGGVDSSVAAKILRDEGHEVIGLFLKLWSDPLCKINKENRCCDYEALEDARKVAAKLKIPFYVINARDEFKKEVVDYFLEEYKSLKTPNPCIVCNDKIKFGLLLKKALEIGCDKLATGHYARIAQTQNYKLFAGIDKTKDQSYMLYHLNQNQLSRVLFPLGKMTKIKVRGLAKKWDLPVKEKPESQEICFFGDKDYRAFLKRYLPEKYFKPGKIVDKKGNVLGEHQGLINYTIGQRKGVDQSQISNVKSQNCNLKLKTSSHSEPRRGPFGSSEESQDKEPLYVIGFDVKKNQLIVGEDKDIYSKQMTVSNVNWINPKVKSPDDLKMSGSRSALSHRDYNLFVKIRYRHPAVKCTIVQLNDNKLKVLFNMPQRAITPGQSAVFYSGDEVLGGGLIS